MEEMLKIDRRRFLFTSLALATCQSLQVGQAAAQVTGHTTLQQLPVVPSTDPAFKELLQSHFPMLASSPQFAVLLCHAAIFKNGTGKQLRALAVDWAVPRRDGGTFTSTTHYLAQSRKHLDLRKGFSREGRALAGRRTIVKKDEYFLVTPLFLCSSFSHKLLSQRMNAEQMLSSLFQRRKSNKLTHLLRRSPDGMHSAPQIRSILFPNSELHARSENGKDLNLQRRFFARRAAEQDEAQSLLTMVQQGHKHAALRKALEERISVPIPKATSGHPRVYARARRRYAKHLLEFMSHHSLKLTHQMLLAVMSAPSQTPSFNTISG